MRAPLFIPGRSPARPWRKLLTDAVCLLLVCLALTPATTSAELLRTDSSDTTRPPPIASPNLETNAPRPTITPYHEPVAESPWQRLIHDFLNTSGQDSSRAFLQRTPPTPAAPDQIRELFLALEPLSRQQLQTVLDRQPPSSALLPFLHLILGDRLASSGEEKEAQQSWQKAATSLLLKDEAMRRIANNTDDKTRIIAGLMIPLSGSSAAMGNNLILAARKALADYRDVNLHLEVADSGGSEATAQNAVKDLISRGSQVIIGPIFQPEAMGAAKTAAAHNIPIIPLNPRQEILSAGGAIFLNAFQPDAQARVMARYAMATAGLRRIAILAPDSDYGRLLAKSFSEEVLAQGGAITNSVLFPEQETDFSAAIKMLVHLDPEEVKVRLSTARSQATLDPTDRPPPRTDKDLEPLVDFDALFLPASAKQVRMIAPQAAVFNIRSPNTALLGASLWNRPELLEESESLMGATFCDIHQASRDQFNATYQKILGVAPIPALSMLTYDSVAILAQLLRDQRLGGPPWPQGITRESGFHGSAGLVRLLDHGVSERPLHLYRIDGKKIVPLALPPQSGAQEPSRRQARPATLTAPPVNNPLPTPMQEDSVPIGPPGASDYDHSEAEIPVIPLSQ